MEGLVEFSPKTNFVVERQFVFVVVAETKASEIVLFCDSGNRNEVEVIFSFGVIVCSVFSVELSAMLELDRD